MIKDLPRALAYEVQRLERKLECGTEKTMFRDCRLAFSNTALYKQLILTEWPVVSSPFCFGQHHMIISIFWKLRAL